MPETLKRIELLADATTSNGEVELPRKNCLARRAVCDGT